MAVRCSPRAPSVMAAARGRARGATEPGCGRAPRSSSAPRPARVRADPARARSSRRTATSAAANSVGAVGDQAVLAVADLQAGRGARGRDHGQPVGKRLDQLQRGATALQQRHERARGAARRRRRGRRRSRASRRAGPRSAGRSRPPPTSASRASGSCTPYQREHLVEQEAQPVAVGLIGEVGHEHRALLASGVARRARSRATSTTLGT